MINILLLNASEEDHNRIREQLNHNLFRLIPFGDEDFKLGEIDFYLFNNFDGNYSDREFQIGTYFRNMHLRDSLFVQPVVSRIMRLIELKLDFNLNDLSDAMLLGLFETQSITKEKGYLITLSTIVKQTEYDKSILIVDDEWPTRHLISTRINRSNYKIEESDNGISALKKIRDFQYDLVIIDQFLPGLRGDSVVKLGKDHLQNTKLIGISSLPGELHHLKKAGCHRVLSKSYLLDEISVHLTELLYAG